VAIVYWLVIRKNNWNVNRDLINTTIKILGAAVCIYLFIVGIGGMEFSQKTLEATFSPLIGLFIGILATTIVQSSSTTTSIVIGMVAADATAVSLYARFLKRIASHSRNIVTSVVNPFQRIGYREK
jgi:uncharacterized membrane protein YeaQ/YmgE (transglycosylase-associated protein family)